jgi:hypothetical protein
MDDFFGAFDVVYGLLLAGALTMVAFAYKELRAARVLIILAVFLIIARWTMWSFVTEQPWWIRGIVGALFGASILGAIPALYSWTKEKGGPAPANTNSPGTQVPVANAPAPALPPAAPPQPTQSGSTPANQPHGSVGIYLGPDSRGEKYRIRDGIFGFPTGVESHGSDDTIDSPTISRDPMPPGYRPPAPSIPPIIDQSLTMLTNAQLRDRFNALNVRLLAIQQFHGKEMFNRPFMEEHKRFTKHFDEVRPKALAIRNELLRRLNQPLVWDLETATDIVNPDTPLAGPTPVSDLAKTLAVLAARLPADSGH